MKEIFNIGSNKNFPTYFYFNHETFTSGFYYKLSEIGTKDVTNITHLTLKGLNETLVLCANKNFKINKMDKSDEKVNDNNLSIMKSHLQKCIRRGEKTLAMETAHYLIINEQLDELLRRLVIITIEDVTLNKNLTTLVWLMVMANKSYYFDDYIYNWIYGYILKLCEIEQHDSVDYNDLVVPKDVLLTRLKKINAHNINYKDVIMSLLVRKSYGGMTGDIRMLDNYINKWLTRFETLIEDPVVEYFNSISNVVPYNLETKIEINKMLLCAFDFHCTNIIGLIMKKKPSEINIDENKLRQLIWNHSSSTNFRFKKNYNKDDLKLWKSLEALFEDCATYYRNKLIL